MNSKKKIFYQYLLSWEKSRWRPCRGRFNYRCIFPRCLYAR